MSPQGPFCQVDNTNRTCQVGETFTLTNGGRKTHVVMCLPQRSRTLAGCLCSAIWSERDDVRIARSWPPMAADEMAQGLHEGWLMAGNCSRALTLAGGRAKLPGGALCTVLENSCSSMPGKAFPPPSPNIFWQVTSRDDQGWDFCADPTYDKERAAQPNDTAVALAALPVNVRGGVSLTTQAGCTCSPLNWTYYPAVVQDADQQFSSLLGCANPDEDPLGAWCPVDPRSCPSYYGAKQPAVGDVPPSLLNRVYFDYCQPVRNKTEAGCLCMGNWKPTFNSSWESRPNPSGVGDLPDPARVTRFSGGVCGNPAELRRERAWCYVDHRTCQTQPAGTADQTGELLWDFCPPGTAEAQPAVAATNPPVLPIAAAAAAAGVSRRALKSSALQWANSIPGVHDMPPPGSGSGGYSSAQYPFVSGDVEFGAAPSHDRDSAFRSGGMQHGGHLPGVPHSQYAAGVGAKPAMLQLPERYGAGHYAAGLPAASAGAIHVGHVHSKDAAAAPGSALFSSYSDSAGFNNDGSMAVSSQQSTLPLLPGALQPRSAPAGSTGSSGSGAAHAAIASRNELHAAAAAEAEARAASLAAKWETGKRVGGSGSGRGIAAAAPALPTMVEGKEQHHQQQQHPQQPQPLPGGDDPHRPPVARILSSPFAHNTNYLPPLASTEPSVNYEPPSAVYGPAALFGKHGGAADVGVLHRVDEMSGTLTRALANGQSHSQQQQQSHKAEGSAAAAAAPNALHVATSGATTPSSAVSQGLNRGPPTPGSKDHARPHGYASSDSDSKRGSRVSWISGLVTQLSNGVYGSAGRGGGEDGSGSGYSGLGDTQMSGLSGLTGMSSWAGTDHHAAGSSGTPGASSAAAAAAGRPPSGAASSASSRLGSDRMMYVTQSVAPPATRHLSGPCLDPNWEFDRGKAVRVLLQVNEEDASQPVTLLLLVPAPPPRPEVLAQIVLPSDKPMAGVDMAIDANRDLAFPSNSFLGQGAFGQVHRALYRGRNPVAVKMLTDPDLRSADPETLRSFKEELSIMAKLEHANIVKCFGGNLEGSNPFIVTELCMCSLDKMIGHYKRKWGTGLPLRHTLGIGLGIASALWHMHPSIVHRDLKPQNVLLDDAGTAKVTDFGLSRMKTHTFVSTQHVEAGTASYMAPECFKGNQGLSEKVDCYALGCLLLECVTGERPWKGCNMVQVAYQVAMEDNRPPLPAVDPRHCPLELVQLIDDTWATNPRERPSSGEIMKRLAQLIRVYVPPDEEDE
ncbi:hypothetical protein OEZ86_000177 [Tetradesmus obliquus]|nr:hypothetical protein OEZ86_000177 [Tetradesmus obliquus]